MFDHKNNTIKSILFDFLSVLYGLSALLVGQMCWQKILSGSIQHQFLKLGIFFLTHAFSYVFFISEYTAIFGVHFMYLRTEPC